MSRALISYFVYTGLDVFTRIFGECCPVTFSFFPVTKSAKIGELRCLKIRLSVVSYHARN